MTKEEAWAEARKKLVLADVARRIGRTRAAVSAWTCVPAEHAVAVAALLGVAPAVLRPDLADLYTTAPDPWSGLTQGK